MKKVYIRKKRINEAQVEEAYSTQTQHETDYGQIAKGDGQVEDKLYRNTKITMEGRSVNMGVRKLFQIQDPSTGKTFVYDNWNDRWKSYGQGPSLDELMEAFFKDRTWGVHELARIVYDMNPDSAWAKDAMRRYGRRSGYSTDWGSKYSEGDREAMGDRYSMKDRDAAIVKWYRSLPKEQRKNTLYGFAEALIRRAGDYDHNSLDAIVPLKEFTARASGGGSGIHTWLAVWGVTGPLGFNVYINPAKFRGGWTKVAGSGMERREGMNVGDLKEADYYVAQFALNDSDIMHMLTRQRKRYLFIEGGKYDGCPLNAAIKKEDGGWVVDRDASEAYINRMRLEPLFGKCGSLVVAAVSRKLRGLPDVPLKDVATKGKTFGDFWSL